MVNFQSLFCYLLYCTNVIAFYRNSWSNIEERPPIAYMELEILEGNDIESFAINGLADSYVKSCLGPFKFQTQIEENTIP